jgi:hypothetical protein
MEPARLFDRLEISRTVSFGPSLKIVGVGLEAKAEVGHKGERQDVFVEALYELESSPTWMLRRTSSTPLQGLQRFHLVVRAQKGATTVGTVSASATIERKRFGLIAFHAALPRRPEVISFEISPRSAEAVRLAGWQT